MTKVYIDLLNIVLTLILCCSFFSYHFHVLIFFALFFSWHSAPVFLFCFVFPVWFFFFVFNLWISFFYFFYLVSCCLVLCFLCFCFDFLCVCVYSFVLVSLCLILHLSFVFFKSFFFCCCFVFLFLKQFPFIAVMNDLCCLCSQTKDQAWGSRVRTSPRQWTVSKSWPLGILIGDSSHYTIKINVLIPPNCLEHTVPDSYAKPQARQVHKPYH